MIHLIGIFWEMFDAYKDFGFLNDLLNAFLACFMSLHISALYHHIFIGWLPDVRYYSKPWGSRTEQTGEKSYLHETSFRAGETNKYEKDIASQM